MPAADADPPEQMECMEVWGGTEPIARQVRMSGLDAWVYSRPFAASANGGDVYYASSCATGRISRLLLADVSGHGAAVGQLSAVLRGLMRRFVNFIDQSRFVGAMNEAFVTGSPDGTFATAIVSTFFAPTNRLTLCNAGHPQPLWYRARDRRWSLLRGADPADADSLANMPLGILDVVDYEQSDLEMGPGDLVVLYTDALSEASDADGHMLNEAGLLRVVQDLPAVAPADLIDALLSALRQLHPTNLAADDVTVLVLCPTGRGRPAPVLARARGMVRLIGQVLSAAVRRPTTAPLPDLRLANIGGAVLPWLSRRWRAKH